MANGKHGGVSEYGLANDDTNVDSSLCDTAMRDTYLLDEAVVLVHEQQPELFNVKILQLWMHVVVDEGRST